MEPSAHVGQRGTLQEGMFICSGRAACVKETEAMRVLTTLNTGFILNGGLVWGPNLLRLFIMMLRPGQTVYWPWTAARRCPAPPGTCTPPLWGT